METLRKVLKVGLALGFALVVGLLVLKGWADAHYYDGYHSSLPLNAHAEAAVAREGYRRIPFQFEGVPGQQVPSVLTLPETGAGPFPCIIFLHGIGQSKGFIDEIAAPFAQAGFAMVTFDQYTRGERRLDSDNVFVEGKALRRRAALNVIETRRLIDYLQTRTDIASDRIYLVGASFGAITGVPAAAQEPRIRAIVLIYGGGRIPKLLQSDAVVGELGWLSKPAAYVGSFFMSPADPIDYVGRLAPRPVLFQNGKEDSLIPAESARALQEAAGNPKDIIWYEGDHVGMDEALTRRVLDDALAWLQKRDKAFMGG